MLLRHICKYEDIIKADILDQVDVTQNMAIPS
jgi:hypothetical protein